MTIYDFGNPVWDYLDEIARGLDKPHLVWNISTEKAKERLYRQREKEELIKEITDRVIDRLSISVETTDAVLQIKQLEKAIDNLCR